MGRGGSKKCKPIPAPPRPAPWCGSKISPHPRPITFAERKKPARDEVERDGLNGTGQNCHPQSEWTCQIQQQIRPDHVNKV